MRHYLLVYDRRQGKLVRHRGYPDPKSALTARFEAEREFSDQPDVEVVVLGAESWDSLARTHARYFQGVHELAETALSRVGERSS